MVRDGQLFEGDFDEYRAPSTPNEDSQAAARSMDTLGPTLSRKVLKHVKSCGSHGAHSGESAHQLGMELHTASARFNDLMKRDLIVKAVDRVDDDGKVTYRLRKRRTKAGRLAQVWIARV